eukprot:gene17886-biopygen1830
MYVNTANATTTMSVEISGAPSTPLKREELFLTGSTFSARDPELNGKLLNLTEARDVDFSQLEPRHVAAGPTTVAVPPLSYGFVSFPDAKIPAC